MKIVLYSTNCPRCFVLNKKLEESGLEFEVSNDVSVLLEKGFLSAPVLEVDGEFMDFGDAVFWVKKHGVQA